MIQSKYAELLFLIGCVLVHVSNGSEGNFIFNSLKNNKPFFNMNRVDEIIGSGSDDRFTFTTMRC